MAQQVPTASGNTSGTIVSTSVCTTNFEKYDLPKGSTDWDAKLFEIINKK
jgi:hypothetical protein